MADTPPSLPPPAANPKTAYDKDFSAFQSPNEASVDRLVQALDRAYHRPGLMLWRSFWQGLMAAIGASVGTALVVALSLFLLKTLGGVELFRPTIDKIQELVLQSQNKALSNLVNTTSTPTDLTNTSK